MNTLILNRDFAHPSDGWYMIEARGLHPNQAAGVIQVIDDPAAESIVNRFNAEAANPGFAGMLIDHEHFSDQPDKETVAYGWLEKLENRDDGIYGRIRWTSTGQKAVDGGDYRFFSTEYLPADLKVLNTGNPQRVRPLRLDGLSLTNKPNNKGGKPITNRTAAASRADATSHFPRSNSAPADQQKGKMKTVCTLLGLSADASEEAVHAEVTKLRNHLQTLESEITPIRNRVTELESANGGLVDDQIAADLAAHQVTDAKIINRLTPVLKPMKNRQERLDFLLDIIGKPGATPLNPGKTTPDQRKLYNRDGKAPEGGALQDAGTSARNAEAAIKQYKIANRCTYQEARDAVRLEKPELFATGDTAQ